MRSNMGLQFSGFIITALNMKSPLSVISFSGFLMYISFPLVQRNSMLLVYIVIIYM